MTERAGVVQWIEAAFVARLHRGTVGEQKLDDIATSVACELEMNTK